MGFRNPKNPLTVKNEADANGDHGLPTDDGHNDTGYERELDQTSFGNREGAWRSTPVLASANEKQEMKSHQPLEESEGLHLLICFSQIAEKKKRWGVDFIHLIFFISSK